MKNKMGILKIKRLIWSMGLPMIVSMVLQAIYNIVDTAFVINMGEDGAAGNLALTYAFPIQLLMVAIGVGTGIGINALLSKNLGEGNKKHALRVAGTGVFIGIIVYLLFLIFGVFFSKGFIAMQSDNDLKAIKMGTNYLTICCVFSFGIIGFAVFERFLQSTGKTMLSTIAQIIGALLNIVLDYVFIYPCNMGIEGAALATVIGQIASLLVAVILNQIYNKDLKEFYKYIKPNLRIIKEIYHVGLSATIMQGLLSVMMLAMNIILGNSQYNSILLQGSFGIYYKIQQFALFACFGLSNTIISIVSFNYGMKNKERVMEGIKHGIFASIIVSIIITIIFEIFAVDIARLFGLASGEQSNEIIRICKYAIRIAALSYIFMAISVAIQGVLQAFNKALLPLLISLFRLIVFLLPFVIIFIQYENSIYTVWWSFLIAEVITCIISLLIIKKKIKQFLKS